ncbi:S1C family serine protease [Natronosalvus rutilus]|uniref:Trypsin-like peptidase domain-containing protein n=1 Tax=Natronosalvus rutilus TaxID=2953753 RepID=A0A9E7NBL1_9EURY|nr:trypsin-like peptidase domain-containing protein [Natronosalvus rutilus]UTF53913.1 trypsin-like peptidase domain-containing protein [Natronosalvus rutilus]
MTDPRPSRRRVLSMAATGAFAAVAGCAEPGSSSSAVPFDQDNTTIDVDQEDRADGSAYTEVYEATGDAVTLVRVAENGQDGSQIPTQGEGSGFLYGDGYLVTNDHVVFSSTDVDVDVQYADGRWASGEVIGTDFYSDLAVVELEEVPESTTPLSFAEERPVVGQEVLAIGNPVRLDGSMSQGIVSGVNRAVSPGWHDFSYPNVVQTDAAVNPGNSGGPLVDMNGAVVGVVHATQGDNIGFAISAALSRRVVPALVDQGEFRHSHMGIRLVPVDPTLAEANDLERAQGVLVVETPDGGPADDVLEPSEIENGIPVGGDVIREIDGEPIPDNHALSTYLALETDPGDTVSIAVMRDGEERTVELTLGERPEPDRGPF